MLQLKIYNSITDIDNGIWDKDLTSDDYYVKYKFISLMEEAIDDIQKYFHVLIFEDNVKVASMSLFLFKLDFYNISTGIIKKVIGACQKLYKRAFIVNILFGGLPLSTCDSSLRVFNREKQSEIVTELSKLIDTILKSNPVTIIALKEFDDLSRKYADVFLKHKYNLARSLPTNDLIIQWNSFDDYRGSLNRKYKQALGYALKRRSELGISIHRDFGNLYNSECQDLYEAVNEDADFQIEKLDEVFFKKLSKTYPESSFLILARVDQEIVGHLAFIETENKLIALFLGYNKMLNKDYSIYFNLMYQVIEIGIEKNKEIIKFGQTADFFKQKLGCVPRKLWFYFRSPNSFLQFILKKIMPNLLPVIEPFQLNVFKNGFK